MKKKVLAICDQEEMYLARVSDYLSHNSSQAFIVMTFTNLQALEKYMEEQQGRIKILLLAESLYIEEINELPVSKLIILREEGILKKQGLVILNKYQSVVSLFQEVMEAYVQDESCEGVFSSRGIKTKLIGFYTPGGNDVSHMAALAFAEGIAKQKKVLYLHLGNYPILREWFGQDKGQEYDLLDLLYFLKQKEEKVLLKLEGMRKNIEGVDYVLPVAYLDDLKQIQEKEWIRLLDCISYGGEYDIIVLDMGEGINGLSDLLQSCDYMITVLQEGSFDYMRMRIFTQMCRDKGMEEVLEKITQISIPMIGNIMSMNPQTLYSGMLGQAVKKMVQQYGN